MEEVAFLLKEWEAIEGFILKICVYLAVSGLSCGMQDLCRVAQALCLQPGL